MAVAIALGDVGECIQLRGADASSRQPHPGERTVGSGVCGQHTGASVGWSRRHPHQGRRSTDARSRPRTDHLYLPEATHRDPDLLTTDLLTTDRLLSRYLRRVVGTCTN
ncbi:hypothetical protein GCM10027169_38820 [Gordonia jinhuaensis]|uniref:Uncharacterized protein n=1 Tax=Gordonia jinhuaensis TaxID=1517702 RepID=A0A916WRN2_9ACTN|nr:hypothetical protein GCM10011489_10450 [Gordonia jinhuaensis]